MRSLKTTHSKKPKPPAQGTGPNTPSTAAMDAHMTVYIAMLNSWPAADQRGKAEYQSINGMLVDGKVGPETFGGLILVADYQKYYNWIQHDWATYSK